VTLCGLRAVEPAFSTHSAVMTLADPGGHMGS